MDAGPVLDWVADNAHFEQVDVFQHAPASCIGWYMEKAARPVTEAQAVHSLGKQGCHRAALRIVYPGNDPEAACILMGEFNRADALFSPVLPV